MARPSKAAPIDYGKPRTLTHGLLERAACPPDARFVLVKDAGTKGLRLRVTQAGGKFWQFETRLRGKLITRSLGEWPALSITEAQTKARTLRNMTAQGVDPREAERQAQAERAERERQRAESERLRTLTVADAWPAYIEARREHWAALSLRDNLNAARAGGEPKKRGKGTTTAGPLHGFMSMRFVELTPDAVQAWAEREGKERPTRARLALRLFRAFLNWCKTDARFSAAVSDTNPATSGKAREKLGKAKPKTDALLREQLPAWFAAVGSMGNATISAYLQCLLLTGARPGELLGLRWGGVNEQWRGLSIRDKDESKGGKDGTREIPLTPYVHHLIAGLPRRGPFVFAGTRGDQPMSIPTRANAAACAVAGVDVTLHGLRRSFGSLAEWLELPAGVVAQIQGHKPSATAEKHYRVRPLDLLRLHHERFEAWILEQAGVKFIASKKPGKLRAVGSAAK